MRTRPAHISPGCLWCNDDHNPDIECRCQPQSTRFHLPPARPKTVRPRPQAITDASGNIVGFTRKPRPATPKPNH